MRSLVAGASDDDHDAPRDPRRSHLVHTGRRGKLRAVAGVVMAVANVAAFVLPFARAPASLRAEPHRVGGVVVERLGVADLRVTRTQFGRRLPPDEDAITLALQLDLTRLHHLNRIAELWQGPIAAAVLVPPGDHPRLDSFLQHNTTPHFRNHVTLDAVQAAAWWRRYPVNRMRNLALDNVQTKWVMVMDSDESPVGGMRLFLDEVKRASVAPHPRTVFALASWQWLVEERGPIPTSHSELVSLFQQGKVASKIPECLERYSPPNMPLALWIYTKDALRVVFRDRYEPHFIVARSEGVRFDDRFHGPGGGKAILEFKMAADGFRFVLLPRVFTFTDETPAETKTVVSANAELTEQVYKEIGQSHNCSVCTNVECERNCPTMLPLWLPQENLGPSAELTPPITVERNVLSASLDPLRDHITLAVQGDGRRLWRLDKLAEQWDGPITAAILTPQDRRQEVANALQQTSAATRRHVDVHLCVVGAKWTHYPINAMRNIAMQDVRTKWVMLVDIDEEVVFSMAQYRAQVDASAHLATHPNTVFALMSFQWGETRGIPPRNRAELQVLLDEKSAVVKAPQYLQAYEPVDFPASEWVKCNAPKLVKLRDAYEPYYIAPARSVPSFDERFVGWGGNYAVQTFEMALSGYSFVVLPHVFTFVNDTAADAKAHNPAARPDLLGLVWTEVGENRGCHPCVRGKCLRDCGWLLRPRQA